MNGYVTKEHQQFYNHLKNGGKVWRNDPLNDIQEVIAADSPTLKGDLSEITRFGYTNLMNISADQEYLFYDYIQPQESTSNT
jgi:hypothetical protein